MILQTISADRPTLLSIINSATRLVQTQRIMVQMVSRGTV